MISNDPVEQSLLHLRVSELERRLARLEEQLAAASPAGAEVTLEAAAPPPADVAQNGHAVAEVELVSLERDELEEGHEGARMVAIELLSSGYKREEVATYLRSTFGIADVEAVLADAGPVPG